MAKITVTTNQGVIVASIETDEHDLSKSMARAVLLSSILEALEDAKKEEAAGY